MNNLTPINSAYSLLDQNGTLNVLQRKQWTGINGSPSTFIFDASLPIESAGASAGLMVMNNQFAIENLTEVNLFFAKGIRLGDETHLGVSLNAGVKRYSADYSSLDAEDPSFRNDLRQNTPNVGFGVMFYSDKYYIGVSVPELTVTSLGNASVEDNSYFRNHYNISGAYLFGSPSDDIRIKPAFLATYTRGIPAIAEFSTVIYLKNMLGVGLNYRSDHKMAGIMNMVKRSFKIGYSYQFVTTSSNISNFANATHEITLSYRFGRHLDKIKLL